MGPDPVVVPAPVFGDDLSFLERIKDLAIQEFISQFAVETLAVTVFPGAPRHDVSSLRAHSAEPVSEDFGDHFWAIITANIFRYSALDHDVGQDVDDIARTDASCDVDGQGLLGVLVDQRQDLQDSSVMRPVHHKIPAPDVVSALWSKADTGAIGQPQTTPFRLLLRHPQAFLLPDPLDP